VPWERRQIAKFWKIDKLPPVPVIEVNCPSLALEPALIYHLLKFYVDNPQARPELGTDTVIQRAQTGAFS
jgi:hypothetical protein